MLRIVASILAVSLLAAVPASAQDDNDNARLSLARDDDASDDRIAPANHHPAGARLSAATLGDAPQPAASRRSRGWTAAFTILHAFYLAGLLMAAGGVLALGRLVAFASPIVRTTAGLRNAALAVAVVAGIASVGAKGAAMSDATAFALFGTAAWRAGAVSSFGLSVGLAVAALVVMVLGLRRAQTAAGRMIASAGALVAVTSLALTGHAASAGLSWLVWPALAVHALCAAYWLGALGLLAKMWWRERDISPLAKWFSGDAVATVALLLAAGAALTIVKVPDLATLTDTAYGGMLLRKLGFVALLLVTAAVNTWWLVPKLRSGAIGRRLRQAIAMEYVLFACILGLSAVLGQFEP